MLDHIFVNPSLLGDEFHIFRREETFRSAREHGLPEENIIVLREPGHFANNQASESLCEELPEQASENLLGPRDEPCHVR